MRFVVRVLTLALAAPLATGAQERPTLTPADYGRWESIGGFTLDPTGRRVAVSIRTVDGDVELRLHPTDGSSAARVLPRGNAPAFTADGRRLVYLRAADDDADEGSPDTEGRLGIVDLEADVDSLLFAVDRFAPSPDGRWVAALSGGPADTVGGDLTVLDLDDGSRTTLGNVDDFAWRDGGALLALTYRTASGAGNGITLFDPDSGVLRSLDAADTRYRGLTWRDDAGDLAVLRAVEVEGRDDPGHDLLLWRGLDGPLPDRLPSARILEARGRADLPDSLRLPEASGVSWSDDGRTVFVGLRAWPGDPGATGDDDEEVGDTDADDADDDEEDDEVDPSPVQIWHWNDDRILRAQEYSEAFDARRTHRAAWHVDEDRLVRLGTELDEPVRVTVDGRWGLVEDLDPYAFERRFGASTRDVYRVDVATGERTLLAEGVSVTPSLGPVGRRALVYADDAWSVVDLATLEQRRLGGDVDVAFTRSLADYDYPGFRPPWGVGGWADDESRAWLHDRLDVWEADLDTGRLVRRTSGAEDGVEHRVIDLDAETDGLDPDAPLWLRLFDPVTKASGYGRTGTGERSVIRLVFDDAAVSRLARADEADRYVFVKEGFDDSPDLFAAGPDLDAPRQLGATNPFQADFAWGRNELLSYTTDAGHDLQAILTYPADYDPSRTYPLILYQYERLSQGLHRYVVPSRTSYYNVQVWSQQGYFVLQPDIVYEPGRPGPSAVDAIEHALDAALAAAPVDPGRMGLVGHSWGGYQAAYVPTRMHRFAAAVAGAAITNFLSFPGAVHWNGGLPELGHWETGQARMAVPPWDDLEGHLESSPVAAIDALETPVLLMHGDADGVVDFRQGLEFYNYARRLGKPVVLLVYPGADHGLRREENQVDYQTRILEWFGHWLKGEPAARWIEEGEDWDTRAKRVGSGR